MQFLFFIGMLVVFYLIGTHVENNHYRSIVSREEASINLPVINLPRIPDMEDQFEETWLVTGSAVISLDYFKRIAAAVINIFGGRIGVFETLVDRARREAILRMKENADGCDMILNLKLETSSIGRSSSDGKGTACVEVLAYGTAAKLKNR